jgi:transposase
MCCFYNTDTNEYRFQAAETTRHDLTSVFKNHKIDLIVMEACGPSGWISDLCQEFGLKTLVCSTNDAAWLWKNVKRKTDKDDSLKLARMAMMGQLTPVHVPKHQVREHRALIKYRKTIVGRLNRTKNLIRAGLPTTALKSIKASAPGAPVENSSTRIESRSPNALWRNCGEASSISS